MEKLELSDETEIIQNLNKLALLSDNDSIRLQRIINDDISAKRLAIKSYRPEYIASNPNWYKSDAGLLLSLILKLIAKLDGQNRKFLEAKAKVSDLAVKLGEKQAGYNP